MKKYMASIIIFLFIVGTLTIFLVYEKSISSGFPSFYIQKTAGEENEINYLMLHGTYRQEHRIGEGVEVSKQGTDYYRDRSYLKRLIGMNDSIINHRQKEYRSFMRGKRVDRNLYYEDENHLIYADMGLINFTESRMNANMKMNIAVLDKKTKQNSSFELTLPDIQRYGWMNIEHLLLNKNTLSIVTFNGVADEQDTTEEHIYQIDLEKQTVIDDQRVRLKNTEKPGGNLYAEVRVVPPQNKENKETLIFSKNTYKSGNEGDNLIDSRLYAYNLKNKKSKELKLPRELRRETDAVSQNDASVYLKNRTAKDVTVYTYDLKTEKIVHQQSFPLKGQKTRVELYHNKIYIVSPLVDTKTNADILVADVKTGKTLYRGVVKAKGGKRLSGDQSVHLEDINIENGEVK